MDIDLCQLVKLSCLSYFRSSCKVLLQHGLNIVWILLYTFSSFGSKSIFVAICCSIHFCFSSCLVGIYCSIHMLTGWEDNANVCHQSPSDAENCEWPGVWLQNCGMFVRCLVLFSMFLLSLHFCIPIRTNILPKAGIDEWMEIIKHFEFH